MASSNMRFRRAMRSLCVSIRAYTDTRSLSLYIYIYIYLYVCVFVCLVMKVCFFSGARFMDRCLWSVLRVFLGLQECDLVE